MKTKNNNNSKSEQTISGDTVRYTSHAPSIPKRIHGAIYPYIRKANFTQILSSNTAPVFGAFAFKLSDFPNYTEFTGLYDQYRVVKVDVQFLALTIGITNTNSAGSIVITCPRFLTVLDYDDSTAPSAMDDLRQYNNCIAVNGSESFIRSFTPASLELGYISGIANSYAPVYKKWHDLSGSNIPHYGIKYGLDNTPIAGPNSAFGYNVECTIHLEFRQSR